MGRQSGSDDTSRAQHPQATEAWTLRSAGIAALFVLGCEAVGGLAGWVTQTSVTTWYPTLAKPWFTPPNWLFAPAWTLLYALMGFAAFLVWRRGTEQRAVQRALVFFGGQLALNALWSFVFFGARSLEGGLAVILALVVAIAVTIRAFWPLRRAAGALLLPYLGWVLYATALNASIWWMN
jgi:tryptophan-rich sensory protein